MGYYCPQATQYATQFPCPAGTFSNRTNLQNVTQCTTCLAGQYCLTAGLIHPTGLCRGGYFCRYGASTDACDDDSRLLRQSRPPGV